MAVANIDVNGIQVKTDFAAGGNIQHLKLVDGTPDSTAPIVGSTENGIWVDVRRIMGVLSVTGPLTDAQLRAAALPVALRGAPNAVTANVASSIASVVIRAAQVARRGLIVFNDSTSRLYLKYGAGASPTSFTVRIEPEGYWELPYNAEPYTGLVEGIWEAANGFARVTEVVL
jgi:hypothetical protein